MKKITLFFVAMLAMAQMNAATPETAANAEADKAEVAAATPAGDDDTESAYQHPFKNNDESTKHCWFGRKAQLGRHQQQL